MSRPAPLLLHVSGRRNEKSRRGSGETEATFLMSFRRRRHFEESDDIPGRGTKNYLACRNPGPF